MPHPPLTQIGVIGPNSDLCPPDLYEFGFQLGKALAQPHRIILCGGEGGIMEAVCKGVKASPHTFPGQTIGILPGADLNTANPYIDIVLPTGLGIARNILIVRSAHILIALGGGAGTLSELAFAWQLRKTVLCVTTFPGWAQRLAGQNIDSRHHNLFIPVQSIPEIIHYLTSHNL